MSGVDPSVLLAQRVMQARAAWHQAHLNGDPIRIATTTLNLRNAKAALAEHHTKDADD